MQRIVGGVGDGSQPCPEGLDARSPDETAHVDSVSSGLVEDCVSAEAMCDPVDEHRVDEPMRGFEALQVAANDRGSAEHVDTYVEGAVGGERSAVASEQSGVVLPSNGADEGVEHGPSGDVQTGEADGEPRSGFGSEMARVREVVPDRPHRRLRRQAARRPEAREHRIGLEGGMSGKSASPSGERTDDCVMVLVIPEDERHGGAGVDENVRGFDGGGHRARTGPARR